MRIGIYDPYLDTLGGGEKYMLTAASCLSGENEVSVFWDDASVLKTAAEQFNIDLSTVTTVANIFDLKKSTINRYIESKKFDAIFFLSDGSFPLVACDLYIHFQFPVEWVNPKSFLEKVKIKRIKEIICNSTFTKTHIDKKFKTESIVVYPPTYYSKDFPKVYIQKKENIILNVGRYAILPDGTSFKKQEFLVDSFKKLYDQGLKDWQLHLVLSVKEKDKAAVEKMKKSSKGYPIKFLENISYKELLKEYETAKIYWHASGYGEDLESHPEKAEHFGITTVEAMINGVVPVVIDAGGQKEIVQDGINGLLWTDQSDMLNKTLLLANDNEKLKHMAQSAIEDSKSYSTDNFCNNLLKVIIK